jgi:hypothetical protein
VLGNLTKETAALPRPKKRERKEERPKGRSVPDDAGGVPGPEDLDLEELEDLPPEELELEEDLDDDLIPEELEDLELEEDLDEASLEEDVEDEEVEEGLIEEELEEAEYDEEEREPTLDEILKERSGLVDFEAEEEEEVEEDEEEIDSLTRKVLTGETGELGEDEFLCKACYLVKHKSQLADPRKKLCRDCV